MGNALESTLEARFWPKVSVGGDDDCWEWLAVLNNQGYGQINVMGKPRLAHRISYTWKFGEIPKGYVIDHACHNTRCVNPRHLRAVTQKQNSENVRLRVDSKSGVRGVTWFARNNKWRARLMHNYKEIFVGYFETLEDAEEAVVRKRVQIFTNNTQDRLST